MSKSDAGKGDADRTTNHKNYRDNYDKIFGKKDNKLCVECGEDTGSSHAARKFCDECNKLKKKIATTKWQAENPENMSANNKRWIENNREKWLARQHRVNNSPEGKAYMKDYKEKNKERLEAYWKEYGQRPEVKAKQKAYRERTDVILKKKQKALEDYVPPTCGVCGAACEKGHRLCYEHSPCSNPELFTKNKRIWEEKRRRTNKKYKIDANISSGIYGSFTKVKKYAHKLRKWEILLGYESIDLINHFESLFEKGMSWSNYGRKKGIRCWEIDHIIPKHTFEYDNKEDPLVKECWSLSNLRPLWAEQNCKGGGNKKKYK